jgi:hypothetical protein
MSRITLKFIKDKSISSDPLKLIQWDADGDLAYVPNEAGDWLTPPTGTLEALDELASRVSDVALSVEAKNANFNAAYGVIYLTTGAIDVQLPVPSLAKTIRIKKTDSSTVTLVRDGLESIEGVAANYALNSTRESVTLVSDGTNWFRI